MRLGYQPPWRGIPGGPRSRGADEVTIERVPLRLVHQSTEIHRPPVYPSGPARRGPFHFPTGRQNEPHRHRFVFPSGPAEQQFPRNEFPKNDFNREQQNYPRTEFPNEFNNNNREQIFPRNDFNRDQAYPTNDLPYPEPSKEYLPSTSTTTTTAGSTGYSYETPAPTIFTTTEIPTTTMMNDPPTTFSENDKPRIAIAISKSTVIHTGKGSFEIDQKTGLPRPIVAEAHSTAILPEPSASTRQEGDNLTGEGTGSFPIITKGTAPKNEEPITESQDPITEPNTTTMEASSTDSTTVAPTAQSDVHPFATSWPHFGSQQSYSVIAPGQAQFVSLGHVNPGVVQFAQGNHFVPTFIQPELAHPTYRSAYHPFAHAAAAYYPIFQPFVTPYPNVIEYAAEQPDLCRGKVVPAVAPVVPQAVEPVIAKSSTKTNRLVITKGGIAIAGPGGFADSGEGGTSIVGPGGTVYSSPRGLSIVGPGGKVVMQGDGTERILARGPIVYYHQPDLQ